MTPEEEMKIRAAWGDRLILRGMPNFIDNRAKLPIQHEITPFVTEHDISKVAVVDTYEFILDKSMRRVDELTGARYTEFTITCQDVIVYRDWKNTYDT